MGGCLAASVRILGRWSMPRLHHLAQSLIPIAACGVFLGLSSLTVTMLRAEGLTLDSSARCELSCSPAPAFGRFGLAGKLRVYTREPVPTTLLRCFPSVWLLQ